MLILTDMVYTEAPRLLKQLCTLERRRNCQLECNIPPNPVKIDINNLEKQTLRIYKNSDMWV